MRRVTYKCGRHVYAVIKTKSIQLHQIKCKIDNPIELNDLKISDLQYNIL